MAQFVKVFNRTTGTRTERTLHAIFDGEDYEIPPGESLLDIKVIPYAMRQNPVMGSMKPWDPVRSVQFLLGRRDMEARYPCTPAKEDPDAIELIDRSAMPGVPHRIQGRAATMWELRPENPAVDGPAAAGGE